MKRVILAIAVALAGAVYWMLAQPAPPPLAALFPPGAAVYLEAKDFGALVAD